MSIIDKMQNLSVKVYAAETGSGSIIYSDKGVIVCITTQHCIDGENNPRETFDFSKIEIELFNGKKLNAPKRIYSPKEELDYCLLVYNKNQIIEDWSIFENVKFLDIPISLKQYCLRGFPQGVGGSGINCQKKELSETEDSKFQILVEELSASTGGQKTENYHSGYSGGAVFIEYQEELYLVGVQEGVYGGGIYNRIVCSKIIGIKEILEKENIFVKYSIIPDINLISQINLSEDLDGIELSESKFFIYEPKAKLQEVKEKISNNVKVTVVVGEAGIGKSFFSQLLVKQFLFEQYVLFIQIKNLSFSNDFIRELFGSNFEEAKIKSLFEEQKKKILVIIDSLDVIAWEEKPTKIVLKFIQFLQKINSVQIILIGRKFDLKYHTSFRELIGKNDNLIELLGLPVEESKRFFEMLGTPIPEKFKYMELFTKPHILKTISLLKEEINFNLIDSEFQAFTLLFNSKIKSNQHIENQLFSNQELEEFLFLIAESMKENNQIYFKRELLSNTTHGFILKRYFCSEGILNINEEVGRIYFFHQRFFDFVLIKSYSKKISISKFLFENQSNLFFLPTYDMYLQLMHSLPEAEHGEYIAELSNILNSTKFSFLYKYFTIRFLVSQLFISKTEINFIEALIKGNIYRNYLFGVIKKETFEILHEAKVFESFVESSDENHSRERFLTAISKIYRKEEIGEKLFLNLKNILRNNPSQSEIRILFEIFAKINIDFLLDVFTDLIRFPTPLDHIQYDTNLRKILTRVKDSFPNQVIEYILTIWEESSHSDENLIKIVQEIIEKEPIHCKSLIQGFERIEWKDKKKFIKHYNGKDIEDNSEYSPDWEYLSYDSMCIWNYDRKTFYHDFPDKPSSVILHIIEIAIDLLQKTNFDSYNKIFQILLLSRFESLHRIAFLSALKTGKPELYFPFFKNRKYKKAPTLNYFLKMEINNHFQIFSQEQRIEIEKSIIENYQDFKERITDKESVLPDKLLCEFWYSLKNQNLSIEFQEISNIALERCKEYLKKNGREDSEENLEEFFTPYLGGIGDFQAEGSGFDRNEFISASTENKINKLETFKYRKKYEVGYWWVEDGRLLQDEFAKDPLNHWDVVEKVNEREDLFRFRSFIMEGIAQHYKYQKENPNELKTRLMPAKAIELALKLIQHPYPIFTDEEDISTPDFAFCRFVRDYYSIVPTQYKNEIRERLFKLPLFPNSWQYKYRELIKFFTKYFKNSDGLSQDSPGDNDYLTTAINSLPGIVLETYTVICFYEKESRKEVGILLNEGLNENLIHRSVISLNIGNMIKNHKKQAVQLMKKWIYDKDFHTLRYSFHFFHGAKVDPDRSKIAELLIKKSFEISEMEIQASVNNNLSFHSFTTQTLRLSLEMYFIESKNAKTFINKIFESNSGEFKSHKYILATLLVEKYHSIIVNITRKDKNVNSQINEKQDSYLEIPHKELLTKDILTLWERLINCSDNEVLNEFLFRVLSKVDPVPEEWLIFEFDNKRKFLIFILDKIQILNHMSLHVLEPQIEELSKGQDEWLISILEQVLKKGLDEIYLFDFKKTGKLLLGVYAYNESLREKAFDLLNELIRLGWIEGLDDIYGIGR